MRRRVGSWLSVALVSLVLQGLGPPEGMAYGPEGTWCLGALPIAKAVKNGAKRSYVWEGACSVQLSSGPSMVSVEVKAAYDGTDRKASEKIEVNGPIRGTFLATIHGCTKDPFVSGAPACAGPSSVTLDGIVPNTVVPTARASHPPIMDGQVPANQAYTSPGPPANAGQVRISKPATNDKFWLGDSLAIEVRFAPANPDFPPQGAVGISWGQEIAGTCTYGVGYVGVPHHTMAQMLGKSSFPFPGRYCIRATAKPGQGGISTWTNWSHPVRIEIQERVASKTSGDPPYSAAAGKNAQEDKSKVIKRLPEPVIADAARQLQALEDRLLRLGANADAGKVLQDLRAYRARLTQEVSDAALQTRLRELTAQVDGLEAAGKKVQSTPPKASLEPSTKAKTGSQ